MMKTSMKEHYNHAGYFATKINEHKQDEERRPTVVESFVTNGSVVSRKLFEAYITLSQEFDYDGDQSDGWKKGVFETSKDPVFQELYAPQIGHLDDGIAVAVDYRTGMSFDSTEELQVVDLRQAVHELESARQLRAS